MTTNSLVALLAFSSCTAAAGEELTANVIMERVAANQNRSVEERKRWTHHQETFIRLSRFNGKMAREEIKEFTVLPTATGFKKEMVRFEGRYEDGGKIINYTEPGLERKDLDIDAELVDDLPGDMVSDDKTRDGIDSSLFPLTANRQQKYTFKLHGKERYRDREVWRITFQPPKDSYDWAGEALIDTTEYQPVLVVTHFSRRIPLMVRTMLGTDIQQLGFRVEYTKLEDGVWFPSKYSGEFRVKAVFFYKRKIAVNMKNSDFRKSDVNSSIEYALADEP